MEEKEIVSYPWLTWVLVLIFSMFGGAASYLNRIGENRQTFRPWDFLSKLVVSGFVGVLTFLVCEALGAAQLWSAAAVGMSGYIGCEVVDMFKNLIYRRIGLIEPEPQGDAKDPDPP